MYRVGPQTYAEIISNNIDIKRNAYTVLKRKKITKTKIFFIS